VSSRALLGSPEDLLKEHMHRERIQAFFKARTIYSDDGPVTSKTIWAGGHFDKQPLMLCAKHWDLG